MRKNGAAPGLGHSSGEIQRIKELLQESDERVTRFFEEREVDPHVSFRAKPTRRNKPRPSRPADT